MADEPAPARAEEQPFALEPGTPGSPVAADPAQTPEAAPEVAEPASDRAALLASLIRTGLSDTAISRDPACWQALETRLPAITQAIMEA